MAAAGFIQCYGLFWDIDEVTWAGRHFRLLGRRGRQGQGLRVADFKNQVGLYVLYDDYGPYYVGLTQTRPLGSRIRDHLADHHAGYWNRFSWFGFRRVLGGCYPDGTKALAAVPRSFVTSTRDTIRDIEALMILGLGTHKRANAISMRFGMAEAWTQILEHERDSFLERALRNRRRPIFARETRRDFSAAVAAARR